MNWIDLANERMEQSRLKKKEEGITEKVIKRKQASWEGGIANKGRKHSDETKRIWSERKIGRKIPKEQVERQKVSQSKTKFLKLLEQYPKEIILEAIEKHGNHQQKIIIELGTSTGTLRKLSKYYSIPIPKKSKSEKQEWAKQNQSIEVNVYKFDKTKDNNLGEFVGTYYSVSEGCRQLGIEKCRGHALAVMNGKRPHTNGYVFKKSKYE